MGSPPVTYEQFSRIGSAIHDIHEIQDLEICHDIPILGFDSSSHPSKVRMCTISSRTVARDPSLFGACGMLSARFAT